MGPEDLKELDEEYKQGMRDAAEGKEPKISLEICGVGDRRIDLLNLMYIDGYLTVQMGKQLKESRDA